MLYFSKILVPFLFSIFVFFVNSYEGVATNISIISSISALFTLYFLLLFEIRILKKLRIESIFFAFISVLIAVFTVLLLKDLFEFSNVAILSYLFVVFIFIGLKTGTRFGNKIHLALKDAKNSVGNAKYKAKDTEKNKNNLSKILDTSVIIDGRILNLVDTHFIDGSLIVPNFVLREIQLISDSPDSIKRSRGRRGLDMLQQLQEKKSIKVDITYEDFTDVKDVDSKLVKLAKKIDCRIITNDFNLNKVAELQGVKVLNLNNLSNALKSVILPGENLNIQVVKEGKDENQGIGYLEEGTMVVIENGRHLLGKEVNVFVTSVIQTNAGRMIFTKLNYYSKN